ncbi:hypothetical protein ACK34I_19515, partial [Aeromonas veronii]
STNVISKNDLFRSPLKSRGFVILPCTVEPQQPDYFLIKKNQRAMATALGYSPQFAAFHHISHAVGHHVLQHYCVYGGVDKVNSR